MTFESSSGRQGGLHRRHTFLGEIFPGMLEGLIEAGDQGALLQMPVTPPEANMLTRTVEVTLGPEGAIDAKVREQSIGQAAVRERGPFRELARKDYVKSIERWITRGATGAEVSKVEPVVVLLTTTVAPGMTPPAVSWTMPVIADAAPPCPYAGRASGRRRARNTRTLVTPCFM